jgi:hypothetical protein
MKRKREEAEKVFRPRGEERVKYRNQKRPLDRDSPTTW